jgi:hypothetical protein
MKNTLRILSVLIAAVMLLSALSVTVSASEDTPYDAFADYGQQTFDVPASEGVKIDGVVSEGEYACTPIEVNKDSDGMTWLDWTKEGFPEEELSEILPYSIKYYVTYDKEGLYIAAEIVEASLYTLCDRMEDIWGTDSLEIDISLDAYGEIPDGTYSQASMLDRLRTNYCLWDDGSGELIPLGLCFTAASYGYHQPINDMGADTYMITRDEDRQLTTYEMFFYWYDLYFEDAVPDRVFLNFQLHLGDSRYTEYVQDGYIACLGGLRYACQLDDDAKADLGTDKGMAPHIFNLTDADKLNGTVTEETTEAITGGETEAPTEAPAETPTEAPTAAPETQAPETEAPAAAPETQAPETETEAEKSGCGSVIGMTAATLAMAAAAAVVLAKKD